MSTGPADGPPGEEVAAPAVRLVSPGRVRGLGITLVALALIELFPFGLQVHAGVEATFGLTQAPAISVPDLVQPVRWVGVALGAVTAALGVTLLARRGTRFVYGIFGLGTIAFLWSFLTWVDKDNSLNLIGLLQNSVIWTTLLAYGSLSGVLCERSGVVNIAIEGQFLAGAFLAALVDSVSNDLWLGLICGAAAGALFGWVLAFLALRYGADQIIVGILIDAFALGLTNFLLGQLFTPHPDLNQPNTFRSWQIPLLSKIPIAGPILFDQNVFVYGVMVLLVVVNVALFRTRWGLRVRAVGEHPKAAATVGIHVLSVRYRNVVIGGAVAGIGGAGFTIGLNGQFTSDMTAGLGFVALAAMIFGRWRPYGALGAVVLFGFATSLVSSLGVLGVSIPTPFLLMAPYLITIVVVAGLVGRVRPPGADGVPYRAE